MFLTKSDFKACFDCDTKFFYRKGKYPSASEENEYLQFLADGGFMVELAAKAQYPEGIDLTAVRDPIESHVKTAELIAKDGIVIFEAGVTHGKYHARIDVLRRRGKILELIEVKSSGVADDEEDDANSPFLTKKGDGVLARWKKYIIDVAFQTHVLQLAYPDFHVTPHLCVVNKSTSVPAAATMARFKLLRPADPKARPQISYEGSIVDLAASGFMVTRPVVDEVALVRNEVVRRAEQLAALIVDGKVERCRSPIAEIYATCRKCDYRVNADKSGFRECWGELATSSTHILDLHRVSQIGSASIADPVPDLIRSLRSSFLDLAENQLGKEGGGFTARRLMQWRGTRDHVEIKPDALVAEIGAHQSSPGWPLHFVDFEACDIALPHHAGLRPFERVAFQWSCHTLHENGRLTHHEWLNDKPEFPNFAFARSLRECIGDAGTVYVWAPYEQTTLKKIAEQIEAWQRRDVALALKISGASDEAELCGLAKWIWDLLGPETKGKRQSQRIRDLHKVASDHYFLPGMGGRTSIKVVLPSIWSANQKLNLHPSFSRYFKADKNGKAIDPYKTLQSLPFGDEDEEDNAVREGTGAIRTYQELIFAGADAATREARRQLLLQYCCLDTAAMVIIWAHWTGHYDFFPG